MENWLVRHRMGSQVPLKRGAAVAQWYGGVNFISLMKYWWWGG